MAGETILVLILAYIFFGIITATIIAPWESSDIETVGMILVWPFVLIGIMFVGFVKLGRMIKETLKRN